MNVAPVLPGRHGETPSPTPGRKVLFVAEAVTLAHVARPVTLAESLVDRGVKVELAWHPRYRALFPTLGIDEHPIDSVASAQFVNALAKGKPVYDAHTLADYVKRDLELLERVSPDVVVGDFRLSLSVSARVAGIPYAALANAYWSPYARPRFTVPDLPFVKLLGTRMGQAIFDLVRPLAFATHAMPLNKVRRRYGLPSLGRDLRRVYTDADRCLYVDIPELVPTFGCPASHSYIGPVRWSPEVEKPSWWSEWPRERPTIYVTLGSSGNAAYLPRLLSQLATLDANVLVATAGTRLSVEVKDNVFVADYLPGHEVVQHASLVVCNGGSPTTQQALWASVPVLGIPTNLDQFLNMYYLERSGVGVTLRLADINRVDLGSLANRLLSKPFFRDNAGRVAAQLRDYPSKQGFWTVIEELAH